MSIQVRKGKPLIELKLTGSIKDKMKNFYRYINDKQRSKENMSPLWKEVGDLVTWNMEKAELLNYFFSCSLH